MNRLDSIQAIRMSLKKGGYTVGSWMQIPNPSVAEIMAQAGYDWVAVDMEHGAFSLSQIPDIFRALELHGTLPLARLSSPDVTSCKQLLDAGAGGVILPMITSAAQLLSLIGGCNWPPTGTRGVGFSRANLFGKKFDDYVEEAQSPLVIAMIEHIDAVDNLPDILAVKGLDAILVGPYDLSASMGLTAQFEHPEVEAALDKILSLTTRSNVSCGLHVVEPSKEMLRSRLQEGYRFLAYSADSVFLNSVAVNPLKLNSL